MERSNLHTNETALSRPAAVAERGYLNTQTPRRKSNTIRLYLCSRPTFM